MPLETIAIFLGCAAVCSKGFRIGGQKIGPDDAYNEGYTDSTQDVAGAGAFKIPNRLRSIKGS